MSDPAQSQSPDAAVLCTTCGLCCTGYFYTYVNLETKDVENIQTVVKRVLISGKDNQILRLPCQFWINQCTIYDHRPVICSKYQCKLLKAVEAESFSLKNALTVIEQAKAMIAEIDSLLPALPDTGFRQQLVGYVKALEDKVENSTQDTILRLKAGVLMIFFAKHFGIKRLFDGPGIMKPGDESS